MTKTIELSGKTCLLVEVPEDGIRFNVYEGVLMWTTPMHDKSKQRDDDRCEFLPITEPNEEWRILGSGKADAISISEWMDIVEHQGIYYKDYELLAIDPGCGASCLTAELSGLSLLSQNNFRKESTVILVKE